MQPVDAPIILKDVDAKNLSEMIGPLRGYLKFASMLWIRAARQPLLDGLIVQRWSRAAERTLKAFCESHGSSNVLLRTDTASARWSNRRGGYIIPLSRARAAVREIHEEGRIAAFLEPLSPYRDLYCLAGITDDRQETMTVEVAGPGFDASDLLRGEISPHERFEVSLPRRLLDSGKHALVRRTHVVRPEEYPATVEMRLVKIGARLKNPAYPPLLSGIAGDDRDRRKKEAIAFLSQTGQSLLLRHADRYRPIPRRYLQRFIGGVASITDFLGTHSCHTGSTAFSGTVSTRGRFVFWDFFPADSARAKLLFL